MKDDARKFFSRFVPQSSGGNFVLRPMGDTLMNGTELEETLVVWVSALCLPKRSLRNEELLIFHLWRIRHQTIRLGVPGGRLDIRSLWGLYKMHKTLWLCLLSGLNISVGVLGLCVCSSAGRPLCRSICLHDCLVVNGTSKSIINILSWHGC